MVEANWLMYGLFLQAHPGKCFPREHRVTSCKKSFDTKLVNMGETLWNSRSEVCHPNINDRVLVNVRKQLLGIIGDT